VQAGYLEAQGGEHADSDHIGNDNDGSGEKAYGSFLIASALDSSFILFNHRVVYLAARTTPNQSDAGPQPAGALPSGRLLGCIDFT
jgi:hypothetical protein